MNNLIGKTIETRGAKYQITGFKMIEAEYANTIKACEDTGKYPAYFFGKKILRSGKLSEKQKEVYNFLLEASEISVKELIYYTGVTTSVVNTFVPSAF